MAALQESWTVLSIPFTHQFSSFLDAFPDQEGLRNAPVAEQLQALSSLLKTSNYTVTIARLFAPLLVQLCARWLDDDEQDEQKFAAFGLLVPSHEELYPVLSQFLSRPSLAKGPLAFITRKNAAQIPLKTLHVLLLAYHRLLEASPHLYEEFHWPIIHLQSLLEPPHPDAGVRLLAIRCFAFHVGMNEPARIEWEKKLVGTADDVDPFIDSGFGETLDVWVLPIIDHKRFIDLSMEFHHTHLLCQGPQTIDQNLLSPRVACVGGVLLLRDSGTVNPSNSFVQTSSMNAPLHQIAKHLSRRHPILLSGPPSSGKMTLIHHLARTLHPTSPNQVISIHLADTSLDARSLLGSYISSPTNPGTFQWRDGVLVKAMKEGKILVLENVDKASSEVLGTIWELVESLSMAKPIGSHATMNVLGREKVSAKEGFALFATRSVAINTIGSEGTTFSPPTFLGHHKWMKVDLPPLSEEDLTRILGTKFTGLNKRVIETILGLWNDLKQMDQVQAIPSSRPYGIRDLIKWCKRIEPTLSTSSDSMEIEMDTETTPALSEFIHNPVLREDVFLEARDIFFASLNPTKNEIRIKERASLFADSLKINQDRVDYLLEGRTAPPQLTKSQDGKITSVTIDRFALGASPSAPWGQGTVKNFALHRPSLNLLAALAGCIHSNEPALLTGETGTGKTTAVTYLASLLSHPLTSLNLSQQTESSDLIGGWKPIEARGPAQTLQERFTAMFGATFSREKNGKYEEAIRAAVSSGKWRRLIALWREAAKRAKERIGQRGEQSSTHVEETPRKRRKLDDGLRVSKEEWDAFENDVEDFEKRYVLVKSKAIFEFVEGPLVTALRRGHWVLLDEINLASPETLEAISSILQGSSGSITLSEQGDLTPVTRHPSFRLFACMNPATDVGKKDLPPHIRSHLTEIYVPPPDANLDALLLIIEQYIGQIGLADKPALDVAEFYTAARKMAESGKIADGANLKPHYSMRTLTHALRFAVDVTETFTLRRALWEGVLMAFPTILEPKSAEAIRALAMKCLLGKAKNVGSLLAQVPPPPSTSDGRSYVSIGPFWLERGPIEPLPVDHYILTPSVQTKLLDLARIILTRRFPVLIEGPTSSGKTSGIEYLARLTGHRFIRINNHEHTDIQEYIGSYVTDPETGRLVFQDGLLVRALRRGDWIVLDELNLAPTDVLEALNRLLDDNRELLVPETGEIIKPHPHFMIFATQNPPGLYGGRKILSRAFRNRFLEVHFQDVPQQELEQIIRERCAIAPSYAQRIVSVFRELQTRRQTGRVFETKHGFATLRDLFRWAGRDAGSVQELAENGYMLIAERTRREDDKLVVKEVIEEVMRVRIDEGVIYDIRHAQVANTLACPIPTDQNVVWTSAMQRLFVLLARALRHDEPVLLVGDTGSGKTSVCELYAKTMSQDLKTLNCHQNTETADLLGGQRPVRNRTALKEEKKRIISGLVGPAVDMEDISDAGLLEQVEAKLRTTEDAEGRASLRQAMGLINQSIPLFEWQDGPLVLAMRAAGVFLLDEISLADDSVLERLNSVLEPSRTLVLAEKGGWDADRLEVTASSGFQLVATMNPGGDYGKKELSPALRNRFTEIWVPMISSREDRLTIVRASWRHDAFITYSEAVVDFVQWITGKLEDNLSLGLRDLLAWVQFSDRMADTTEASLEATFYHAAHMVVLDGLASLPQTQGWSPSSLAELRQGALHYLATLVPLDAIDQGSQLIRDVDIAAIGPFKVPRGSLEPCSVPFEFNAPTTSENARRVLRACQLSKPILLEGSPGVGKTSLITALAAFACQRLCRVNLSDQTDLMDLFGSDLPVEDGYPGEFAWKDAAFLQALQQGDWVLLDEMNLASQSVLEGLNAILDHRGTVYVPELARSFTKHPHFRLFAAQNPVQQGGGRKGLPKSFINRFTKVYMQELAVEDLHIIANSLVSTTDNDQIRRMIKFNAQIHTGTSVQKTLGRRGSPWEFNLRDIMRWLALMRHQTQLELHPDSAVEFVGEIYTQRFRSLEDRQAVASMMEETFGNAPDKFGNAHVSITPHYTQLGHSIIERQPAWRRSPHSSPLLQQQLNSAQAVAKCVEQGWLVILVGPTGAGKTSFLRQFSDLYGAAMVEFHANSATDTTDILGSFEQEDTAHNQIIWTAGRHRSLAKAFHDAPFTTPDSLEWQRITGGRRESFFQLLKSLPEGEMKARLEDYANEVDTREAKGRFVWVDGPLVRSLKEGSWFVLDNANLCNPSVLDRLNSLCEVGGLLSLTERGLVNGQLEVLRPHPRFRLFMTMDPANGELSRAMRNRGLEINIDPGVSSEDRLRTSIFGRNSLISWPNQYHEFRLPQLSNHLSSTSLQILLRLCPVLFNLPPNVQLSVALQTLPRNAYGLFRRLREFGPLVDNLDCFSSSHDGITNFFQSHPDRLGLPSLFLASHGVEPLLNANIFSRIRHIGLASDAEWNSQRRDLALVLIRGNDAGDGASDNNSVFQTSQKLASNHTVVGEVSREIKDIYPVLVACRRTLEVAVSTPSPAAEFRNYLTLAELWENALEITRQGILDYSLWYAMLQEMERILRLQEDSELKRLVIVALQGLRLKSGLAMADIWAYHKSYQVGVERGRQLLRTLDPSNKAEPAQTTRGQLRVQAFDAAALGVLDAGKLTEGPNTNNISIDAETDQAIDNDVLSLVVVLQLGTLGTLDAKKSSQATNLERLCGIMVETPGYSVDSVLSMHVVKWNLAANRPNHGQIAEAFGEWISFIWEFSGQGAEIVTQPTALLATIRLCAHPRRPIASITSFRSSLQTSLSSGILHCELPHLSRVDSLVHLFSNDLAVALTGIKPKDVATERIAHTATTGISHLVALLQSLYSEDDFIRPLKGEIINSCNHLLESREQPDKVLAIAVGWVNLGLMMLHLYIPSFPLDPNAANADLRRRSSNICQRLSEEIRLQRHAEQLLTGNMDNLLVEYLQKRLLYEQERLHSLPPSSSSQRDILELQTLLSELLQFHDQLLDANRMNSMLQGLNHSEVSAANREHVNQDSWARFLERIQTKYVSLADIIHPVLFWMNRVRFGASLMRHHTARHEGSGQDTSTIFLRAMTAFPSSLKAIRLLGDIHPPPHLPPSEWASIRISASISQLRLRDPIDIHRQPLANAFDQLFGLWLHEQMKQEEEESKISLYKVKKTAESMRTDEELEAEEFRQLFPEYGDIMDDAPTSGHVHIATSGGSSTPYQMFVELFPLHTSGPINSTPIFPITSLFRWSTQATKNLGPELDQVSSIFQLRSAFRQLQELRESPLPSKGYNFYEDSNIPQVCRAIEAVDKMNDRLLSLSQEWPDQMVLQHLSERCTAIMQLDLKSSLAKVLSALEQLLVQSDDWQRFASKEVSIETHQRLLSTLIIEWRRIELACWSHLLDTQAVAYSNSMGDWWYTLFRSIIHVSRAPLDEAQQTTFWTDLLPLLEGFMTTSPLGQFATRLQLLERFEKYISTMFSVSETESTALPRIQKVLSSLVGLYGRFKPKVHATLLSRRESIDKEVKSFIKLASWKDINVLALKASAQRTHHHLHKCIRKFRALLQEPVTPLLAEFENTETPQSPPRSNSPSIALVNWVPSLEDKTLPTHLRQLDDSLGVFHRVSCGEEQPSLNLGADRVEEFSSTIVANIAALQHASPPKNVQNKVGWAKNLLTRKRRGFADLLKACKDAGLSSQPTPDVQARQSERLWLLEHRSPLHSATEMSKQMDHYLDRILWTLPKFQASLSSHSEQISTRDLTKLLNFTQGVFGLALESRDQIHKMSNICSRIDYIINSGAEAHSGDEVCLLGPTARNFVVDFLSMVCHTVGSTQEILDVAQEYTQYAADIEPFDSKSISSLKELLDLLANRRDRMVDIQERIIESEVPILLTSERDLFLESATISKAIVDKMGSWCAVDGRVHHLCKEFMTTLNIRLEAVSTLSSTVRMPREYIPERPIGIMLVIMERLGSLQPFIAGDRFIKEGTTQFRRIASVLELDHLWRELGLFMASLESSSASTVLIQRLCPFLQRFSILIRAFLNNVTEWAKSLFKLASILINLGQDLADRGFCKPQEPNDQSNDSSKDAKMDGTGVGEGVGDKNVSDEIEDEAQVEGMQGDEADPEERKENKEKDENTLEMDQDFDGELESVGDQQSNEESEESDGEEEEAEERMENLDPADPDAVDEKMWEGKNSAEHQKDEMQSKQEAKEEQREGEMAAKQNEPESLNKADQEQKSTGEEREAEEKVDDETLPEEGPDVDNLPNDAGAPMDERVQEDNILDLPEGLELEADQDEQPGEEMEDEFGDEAEMQDVERDESVQGDMSDNDPTTMMEAESDTEQGQKEEKDVDQDAIAKADEEQGHGQQDTAGGVNSILETGEAGQLGESAMETEDNHADKQEQQEPTKSQGAKGSTEEQTRGKEGDGVTTEGAQDNPTTEQKEQGSQKTLADAFAQVQKRYQEIQKMMQQEHRPTKEHDASESQVVEHVDEDAEDTKAALGRANEDEVTKIRDLNIVDEVPDLAQDEDIQMHEDPIEQPPPLDPSQTLASKLKDASSDHARTKIDIENALTREDILPERSTREQKDILSDVAIPAQNQMSISSEEVEAQLIAWQKSTNPTETVDSIWRLYSSLTHELAWALCEQLRLILEPTKATRLRGDYRTGKRLNMKKIIPYIASEYTKDKIWLRRTRPSQREYQVLLALDDSRSMSESHSEHLAFETLALVSKALTRLEAGDISVVKFGETVDVLHGFDDGPFNDTVGAKVIGSFGFNQTSTDVLSLVETSLMVLQNARDKRTSSSSANLWQLEIIISDGICSNHEKLRATLRRAREQRVMVVFIIVDSLSRSTSAGGTGDRGVQNSILSMKQVRQDLSVERYLDTFPFEYYLVLRSVDALPEVLSGTLKQFFERIAEE